MAQKGVKISEEVRERVKELGSQGLSVRGIQSQLKEEGISIGVGSVMRIRKGDGAPGGTVLPKPTPDTLLPPAAKVPMTPAMIEKQNEVRLLELELKERAAKRRLALLEREERLEQREAELDLKEREQATLHRELGERLGGAQNEEERAQLRAKIAEAEEAIAENRKLHDDLVEERHQLELDALQTQLKDISDRLEGRGVIGKTEMDFLSEALSHGVNELGKLRGDVFSFLNAPGTRERFNPFRMPPGQIKERGEAIAATMERGATAPPPGTTLRSCPKCNQTIQIDQAFLATHDEGACPYCGTGVDLRGLKAELGIKPSVTPAPSSGPVPQGHPSCFRTQAWRRECDNCAWKQMCEPPR